MTEEQKKSYTAILENACNENEYHKDLLIYGKGVSPEQRFFWISISIQTLEQNIFRLYLDEKFSIAEQKRCRLFVENILKIAMGYLIWHEKRASLAINYTIQKMLYAHQKHQRFDVGFCENHHANAYQVVREELIEFLYALHSEKKDRQLEEAYDVAVTCCRYLNHEWEEE